MIATIRRRGTGFEITSRLHGAGLTCAHGTFPTLIEACEAAARQGFALRNATFDRALGGWTTTDIALFPFDVELEPRDEAAR
jgi:hypothetical protein